MVISVQKMQVKAQSDVKTKKKATKKPHKNEKRKNTQYLMFVTLIVNDICTVNEKFLQV